MRDYLSVSQVTTFLACPRKWKFRYVDEREPERKSADLARQGEALKSALLASLGHDLRTPLTAIRVAASNLREGWATEEERRDQGDVILFEVERLSRLFQNTLDMARIDASAVNATNQWVHLSELYEAARDQVSQAMAASRVHLEIADDRVVHLDPRLTAAALAHVLENAVHYSPAGSPVSVSLACEGGELVVRVDDRGSRRRTCPTCSNASIAAPLPGNGRSAPAWGCRLRAACSPCSRGESGRRTAPKAEPASRSPCPWRRGRQRPSHDPAVAYSPGRRRALDTAGRGAPAAFTRF